MNTKKFELETTVLIHPNFTNEIISILRSSLTPKCMMEKILDYHENDIAEALELLSIEERNKLYSLLDAKALSDILEYTSEPEKYINELSLGKKVKVLSLSKLCVIADFLRNTDIVEKNTILEMLSPEIKNELSLYNSFNDDEIGSKMTTNYISIKNKISVRDAMSSLIEQAEENDNISTIYVTDKDDILVGAIDLKDLITAKKDTDIEAITLSSYPYVYTYELVENCIERIKDYSEDSIPVLDLDNKLRGVLTSCEIMELTEDELSEDYARLAGLLAEEDLKEPLKKSIKKRFPWLIILLGLGLIVSSVVGLFEEVVAHLTIIMSFQSLILDMAGNTGTQSLAVTIRVLTDERLSKKQKFSLVKKECRVGLVNGLALGSLSVLLVALYLIVFKTYPLQNAFAVSLCTGIALIISIILASITGTVIPILFKKIKIDPAVASGPLITTINDLVAVVSYYSTAWLLLINIMKM